MVVGPHRHLRRLRLRARDRAALSGDQRADGRVPARRSPPTALGWSTPASPATGSTSTRCRSIRSRSGWRSRSPTRGLDAPSNLDGDSDSPDAVVGAAGPPTITRTTSYKPWKYMYPRTWSISVYSDALGLGRVGFISTTHRRSGRQPQRVRQPAASRSTATLRSRRLLVHAPVPVVRPRTSGGPRSSVPGLIIDGVNTLYRQHVLGGTRVDARDLPADAVVVGRAVVRLRLHRVRARRSAARSRIRRAASSSNRRSGPDANVFLSWYFSNVHAWHYSISSQEGRFVRAQPPLLRPGAGRPVSHHRDQRVLAGIPDAAVGAPARAGAAVERRHRHRRQARLLRPGRLLRAGRAETRCSSAGPQCCTFLRGYPPNSFVGDSYQIVVGRIPRAAAADRARLPDVPDLRPAAVGRGVRRRRQRLPGALHAVAAEDRRRAPR